MHTDEILHLQTILENQRGISVQHARREDSSDAGIRIGKSLPGAVDIEVAECNRGNAVGAPKQQRHLFLVFFRERIDGSTLQRLVFVCREWLQYLAALCTRNFPPLFT